MTDQSEKGARKAPTQDGPYVSEGLDRPMLQSKAVLDAMAQVPRHKFVAPEYSEVAYSDRALPIAAGQTISQPFIVALMTQEAKVSRGSKVLEIGTGSGYQAAVLAELGAQVYSIEIVPELAEEAKARLTELEYKNVNVKQGDGWRGWPEEAPFDAILVTASAPSPPVELLRQLADHGRMVVPIENRGKEKGENLVVIERTGEDFTTRNLGAVKFVPLTGVVRDPNEPENPVEKLQSGAARQMLFSPSNSKTLFSTKK